MNPPLNWAMTASCSSHQSTRVSQASSRFLSRMSLAYHSNTSGRSLKNTRMRSGLLQQRLICCQTRNARSLLLSPRSRRKIITLMFQFMPETSMITWKTPLDSTIQALDSCKEVDQVKLGHSLHHPISLRNTPSKSLAEEAMVSFKSNQLTLILVRSP